MTPDNRWQHLVDAVGDYVSVFKMCEQSDGSDIVALLHQLVEAGAAVNRVMRIGPIVMRHVECVCGPPPEQPAARSDPAVEAQYQDDLARWNMRAWQILLQNFLKPIMGGHLMLDLLHNDLDRGLAGDTLRFIRAVGQRHGNTRDVLQRTARDAMVFTVILASAELNGKDRIQQVLDDAGIGISERTFPDMRKNVEDKAALGRMTEEAKRRRYNRLAREKADRQASRPSRGRPVTPRPDKPMAAVLIAGSLTDAELIALYPKRYPDLARFGTVAERIQYLFSRWNAAGGGAG